MNALHFIASHGPVRIICADTIPTNLLANYKLGYTKTSKPRYVFGRVWITMTKEAA